MNKKISSSVERRIAKEVVNTVLGGKIGKKDKKTGWTAFGAILFVVVSFLWVQFDPERPVDSEPNGEYASSADASSNEFGISVEPPKREDLPSSEAVFVQRCVDGDTFVVVSSKGKERVRLIGANTPETVKPNWPVEPFGPEASAYVKRRVVESSGVAYLVSDGQKYDKYGRRLAVMYLGNDKVSLNEELARQGLARVELKYSYSKEFKTRLSAAQKQAEIEKLGIHSMAK